MYNDAHRRELFLKSQIEMNKCRPRVDTAGIARKWEGERRCQAPVAAQSDAECVNLTARMYNSGQAEANGLGTRSQQPEARSQ